MRKVILFIATSLDGYIAGENDNLDWLFSDQDYGYKAFYDSIGITLTGRRTYEVILSFPEFPYPDKTNYVFSRNPDLLKHELIIPVQEDVAEFTAKLKQEEGKDIWLVGGASLIEPLYTHDLIDEYVISIHPVILGSGIPLFRNGLDTHAVVLKDCQSFSSGLVQLHYLKRS